MDGTYDALVESCLQRFRDLTSQAAIGEHPCCACGEDRPDTEMVTPDEFPGLEDFRQRQQDSDSAQDLGDETHIPDPRLEYLTPSTFLKERVPEIEASLRYHHPGTNEPMPAFDGLILDPAGFVLQEGELFMRVCGDCQSSLKKSQLPARAIANDNWFGAPSPSSSIGADFASLTWAERQLIALERTTLVLQLRGAPIYDNALKQRGARGNAISHKHDTEEVCTMLPRPVESLCEVLKVIFTSNRPMTADDIKWAALVDLPKVLRCFQWLKHHHSGYAKIELHAAYADLDEDVPPAVPECVMVAASQLPDQSPTDGLHGLVGHGNFAADDDASSESDYETAAVSPHLAELHARANDSDHTSL